MAVVVRHATLEEFLDLPEEKPALEFADGVITQKVSPKGHHSVLQAELTRLLDAAARPRRFGRVLPELRTTYAGASRVPDVALYRWERIPVDDSGLVANDFRAAPDVAIEIVSPGQSVNSLVRRCTWYVSNGVELALLVDPSDRSVAAYRAGTLPVTWRGADRIDLGDILPGFELTVEDLFGALRLD